VPGLAPGTHDFKAEEPKSWVPAFAGTTVEEAEKGIQNQTGQLWIKSGHDADLCLPHSPFRT